MNFPATTSSSRRSRTSSSKAASRARSRRRGRRRSRALFSTSSTNGRAPTWARRGSATLSTRPTAAKVRSKFIPAAVQQKIAAKAGVKAGDALFFAADKPGSAAKLAGAARTKIGEELGLLDKTRFEFCWIVDFPMYEWNEEEKKIDFSHNPFSMPNLAAEEFLKLDV